MRLGIIMLGTGAYAAANIGALRSLRARGIEPYAVCGMHFGALIAAQYLYGYDENQMEETLAKAARRGGRLLCARHTARSVLRGAQMWLCDASAIGRVLCDGSGDRMLSLCERRGIFPCRAATSGRRIVFSSLPYAQGTDTVLTMQATVAFAARAAMAQPPFLQSASWLGSLLVPEENPAWAAGQLLRMGADRVLVVEPRAAVSHEPDALELSACARRWALEQSLPEGMGVLRIMMPADTGALCFEGMPRISQAGFAAAQAQLDGVLSGMGMAACRVLPFRRKADVISRRI